MRFFVATGLAVLGIFLAAGGASVVARADAFSVGLGADFSQLALTSSNGRSSWNYWGPGALVDMRWRVGPGQNFGEFGIDIFGQLGLNYAWNPSASTGETATRMSFGGGVDVRTAFVFFGGQLGSQHISISDSYGGSAQLTYTSLGFRGGVHFMTSDRVSVMMGATYLPGVAFADQTSLGYNQPVHQLGAFVLFHIKLVSDSVHMQSFKR